MRGLYGAAVHRCTYIHTYRHANIHTDTLLALYTTYYTTLHGGKWTTRWTIVYPVIFPPASQPSRSPQTFGNVNKRGSRTPHVRRQIAHPASSFEDTALSYHDRETADIITWNLLIRVSVGTELFM